MDKHRFYIHKAKTHTSEESHKTGVLVVDTILPTLVSLWCEINNPHMNGLIFLILWRDENFLEMNTVTLNRYNLALNTTSVSK